MFCLIKKHQYYKLCDALHDLIPIVLCKKLEKYTWRSVAFSKVVAFNLQLYS